MPKKYKHWTARKVAANFHKKDITALLVADGLQPGSAPFLSRWKIKETEFISSLTETRQALYQDISDRWNTEGPPLDVQRS